MKRIESELSTAEIQSRPLHESDIAGHDAPGLPEDQMVRLGEDATFTAPEGPKGTTYQWVRVRRGGNEPLVGQTGRTMTIKNTTVKAVGFYRCFVTTPDKEELSKPASLMVTTPAVGDQGVAALSANAITVYAQIVTTSGTMGTCPGSYVGSVNFVKPSPDWGWAPIPGAPSYTAADLNQSDTKVRYQGKSYDVGCAQTTVSVPDPCPSVKYRFAIYFPTTIPSTDPYPITLTGFNS